MQIVDFNDTHIEQAMQIAIQNYEEARGHVPALPPVDAIPDLTPLAKNGLGVTAFDGDEMVGFLCVAGPFQNAFRSTDATGIFSPMGANGAVGSKRAEVYARMYQAAGEKWIQAGASSHAVCLYAHDKEMRKRFFQYGFGLRCIDAIRPMKMLSAPPCIGYSFRELPREEYRLIFPLNKLLVEHMKNSPTFMCYPPITDSELFKMATQPDIRYFAAEHEGQTIAYVKIADNGGNFACDDAGMINICGAYCLPEFRGIGVFQNLINFLIQQLQLEGYVRLGVDFESINPNAYGFWPKYFEPYTNSVVRRVDEYAVRTL